MHGAQTLLSGAMHHVYCTYINIYHNHVANQTSCRSLFPLFYSYYNSLAAQSKFYVCLLQNTKTTRKSDKIKKKQNFQAIYINKNQ